MQGNNLKEAGLEVKLYLQPISGIHTTTGFDNPGIGKPVSPYLSWYSGTYCRIDPGYRLHQFHESFHRTCFEEGKRSRCKESNRCRTEMI